MIPLMDSVPWRRFPALTVLLIVANFVAFVADRMGGAYHTVELPGISGSVQHQQFVGGLAERFALSPHMAMHDPRALWTSAVVALFLHSNWLHIGANMLYLWVFGANVEDVLGRLRFLLLYVAGGVLGNVAQASVAPLGEAPIVGSAGAVAAVMAAHLALFGFMDVIAFVLIPMTRMLVQVPSLLAMGFWALLQFVNAHLGGGDLLRGGGIAAVSIACGFALGLLIGATGTGAARQFLQQQRMPR